MNKLICPFCKNDKDFARIEVNEEYDASANLCLRCGRVWMDETESSNSVYNKDRTILEASLDDEKE